MEMGVGRQRKRSGWLHDYITLDSTYQARKSKYRQSEPKKRGSRAIQGKKAKQCSMARNDKVDVVQDVFWGVRCCQLLFTCGLQGLTRGKHRHMVTRRHPRVPDQVMEATASWESCLAHTILSPFASQPPIPTPEIPANTASCYPQTTEERHVQSIGSLAPDEALDTLLPFT